MLTDLAIAKLARNEATSLVELVLASCRDHGSRPALWVDDETLTYAQLQRAAETLAAGLRALRGDGALREPAPCGLLVNRTATAYVSILASLMAGNVYVPLNPAFPRERLSDIISSAAMDMIIIDARSLAAGKELLDSIPRTLTVVLPDHIEPGELKALPPRHQYITLADIERASPAAAPIDLTSDAGAYLLFTSGSTGTPKGVMITHGNVLAYVRSVSERYQPGPEDRFSQLFDFSFDLSVHDIFVAWGAGACLYCAPEGSLATIGRFIRTSGLTFWLSVPATAAFMRQMRMLKAGSYPSLRWSLFCGEALPMSLARAWQAAAPNSAVENLYGPTEATIAFTTFRLPEAPRADLDALHTVPIGRALPGQKTMIIDEDGHPLAPGQVGELCLGGSQVAGGYWRAPELTAQRFRPPRGEEAAGMRWYRTGDLAVMSEEHGLLFRGRIDRQAKIRGYRVELLEVENAMRAAAGTDTVGAVAWPVGEDGLALGLMGFVSRSYKSGQEIIEACSESLPSYMIPDCIHQVADWPLNANGKTDYKSLVALLQNATA